MAKQSPNPTDKPTKPEKQAKKAQLRALGIKPQDLDAVITPADENDANLTARAIEVKLRGWLATRPKRPAAAGK